MTTNKEKSVHPAPEETLANILSGLKSAQAETRLKNIEALGKLSYSNRSILRQLEMLAATDRSKAVRAAALAALDSRIHRQIQKKTASLPLFTRQVLVEEIERWQKEGLLQEQQAAALKQRYTFDASPPPAAKPAQAAPKPAAPAPKQTPPPKPAPTLAQTLLSETSIKIALYLGAFFVIAAALILAALVESIRLPILLTVTVFFGFGAVVIRKKLPQPSFTLFIVFSTLIPIDASVLANMLDIDGAAANGYWSLVLTLTALLWGFSTWLYHSRFFSLAAFAAAVAAILNFAAIFDAPIDLSLLLASLVVLGGLFSAKMLRHWKDRKFALPLLALTKTTQSILLLVAFFSIFIHLADGWGNWRDGWWLVSALIWLVAAADFAASEELFAFKPFAYLSAAALIPVPWLFLNVLGDAASTAQITVSWLWGVFFVALSTLAPRTKWEKLQKYAQPFLLGSGAVFLGALLLSQVKAFDIGSITPTFLVLTGTALTYTALHVYRPRVFVWLTALIAALGAYFSFFALPFMEGYDVFAGYQLAGASLLLLTPDLFKTANRNADRSWRWPLLGLGLLLTSVNSVYLLGSGMDHAAEAALIFGLYTLLSLAYALRQKRPALGYLGTAYMPLTILFTLQAVEQDRWLGPLIALAVLYYFLGLGARVKQNDEWANVLRYSGLGLGVLVSISAPFEGSGLAASIPVVIAATLFAVEAFRRRNVWLGFPANALYLMAYFMILANLNVDEPQFYSVGAAMLGMVMHYLLVRSGSKTGAFLTGMFSQLVLLSTTYIQMIANEDFIFFAILFFQALVVLIYGIVIRSRSLVIAPIIFVVLAVATVVFNILQGLSTVILIGCTGIFLILLGILALVLREKIATLREQLSDWNA
ncbi:MAG: hypothetical protein GXP40_02665 [Chloroflexi bacterium]|nr:hypothetical protein [Chloroflexota bacterium]